jgi:hypothetical protein
LALATPMTQHNKKFLRRFFQKAPAFFLTSRKIHTPSLDFGANGHISLVQAPLRSKKWNIAD